MNAPYGLRLPAPFANFDLDTSCWRTWQPSLLPESLPEQPPTFPRSGMWDSGGAYELPMSEPLTGEPESSSLLPTPNVATARNSASPAEVARKSPGLPAVAELLLPTPNAADGMGGPGNSGRDGGLNLRTAATELLPTPSAMNAATDPGSVESWQKRKARELAKHNNGNGIGTPLGIAVQLLPTPNTANQNSQDPAERRRRGHGAYLEDLPHLLPTPTAADHKASGGASQSDVTLTDAVVRTELGTRPNPRLLD